MRQRIENMRQRQEKKNIFNINNSQTYRKLWKGGNINK